VLRVDAATNLVSWITLATVTNVTGTMEYVDTNSPGHSLRFYHVVKPGQAPVAMLMVNPQRLGDGSFRFTVTSAIDQAFRVEATTNFTAWATLATLTNATGSLPFTDPAATGLPRRYYRVITP
jgi:hypothetical protein